MDTTKNRDELNEIIPGVVEAYESLKTKNGMGIYTSNGSFYNHTFFGRDNAMAAKFVTDFDHAVTRETIIALASLQGTEDNPVTQEALGRIHHEYRDLKTWQGSWLERRVIKFFLPRWGGSNKQLLTYYALDTTALFIRLVNKYVKRVDKSLLDHVITNQSGEKYTIAEALARAADWMCSQVDETNHLVAYRTNPKALPYQTFQDSSTAFPRPDGSLANFRAPIAFTEIQAFAIDALDDATRLLSHHDRRHQWQDVSNKMRHALLRNFWSDDIDFFGSAIDKVGLVEMPAVAAGWTLNTSFWDELDDDMYRHTVSAIVTKLFSEEFLTPVGLRTRSLTAPQPLPGVVEYHGRLSVWPMFTFMVIEGLRRHRLHRLAEQLENRLINGINASGEFEEFFVVDGGGHLLKSVKGSRAEVKVDAQMYPEKYIAFTVIPSMVLAKRAHNKKHTWPSTSSTWRNELEDEVLSRIDNVERVEPGKARDTVPAVIPTKFRRVRGNLRTMSYFLSEYKRMK